MENSIEEDIKILEKFKNDEMQRDKLERDVRCGGWKIGDIYKCLELDNAIDNILSDYKRVLKENNRLEEQVEYDKTHIYTPQTIKLNFISKSKIKDKIEQLKEKEESDLRCYGFAVDTHLALQTLQELLDGSDTDVGGIGSEN